MRKINAFDCDGVLTIGIRPSKNDIIITGRSFEEKEETLAYLKDRYINNEVFFNNRKYNDKTRKTSGEHKAETILNLKENGILIETFFEDDEIQKEVIEEKCPWVNVVHILHDLTEKENVRYNSKGEKI